MLVHLQTGAFNHSDSCSFVPFHCLDTVPQRVLETSSVAKNTSQEDVSGSANMTSSGNGEPQLASTSTFRISFLFTSGRPETVREHGSRTTVAQVKRDLLEASEGLGSTATVGFLSQDLHTSAKRSSLRLIWAGRMLMDDEILENILVSGSLRVGFNGFRDSD